MIARLHGILIEKAFTRAVVECGGVGYEVNIPLCTYDKLPEEGKETTLFTELHVREDDMSLYGFFTRKEQQIFRLLITVNGIGAKTALNILSSMNIASFCAAIVSADVKTLKKISGVGPKSAERMIVELRDKIRDLAPETAFPSAAGKKAADVPGMKETEEAILALEALGFNRLRIQESIGKIVETIPEQERSVENIIRKALQSLNKG